jgi:hypothetical protein
MKVKSEAMMYRNQMIELAYEAKKTLVIPSNIIENEKSDVVLGKIVRLMYETKRDDINAQIEYLQNQKLNNE